MAYCEWESLPKSHKMISRMSMTVHNSYIFDFDGLIRERREHRIFENLLQMIPELQERLMGASAEEIVHVGELVGVDFILGLMGPHSVIDTERLRQCKV
jgi:hypothetical protein